MSDLERLIAEAFDIPSTVMEQISADARAARERREAEEATLFARVAQTVVSINAYLAPYGLSVEMCEE